MRSPRDMLGALGLLPPRTCCPSCCCCLSLGKAVCVSCSSLSRIARSTTAFLVGGVERTIGSAASTATDTTAGDAAEGSSMSVKDDSLLLLDVVALSTSSSMASDGEKRGSEEGLGAVRGGEGESRSGSEEGSQRAGRAWAETMSAIGAWLLERDC